MGKLVVQVDEVDEHGNMDLANRLKPILTEPTTSVNVKYGPQMVVKNFARRSDLQITRHRSTLKTVIAGTSCLIARRSPENGTTTND